MTAQYLMKWTIVTDSAPFQLMGLPSSSAGKESACSAGYPGWTPGLGRSTGEEIGSPLQYSWASLVAQLVKNLPAMWETSVWSLCWENPWRGNGYLLQYSGLENSMACKVHGIMDWSKTEQFSHLLKLIIIICIQWFLFVFCCCCCCCCFKTMLYQTSVTTYLFILRLYGINFPKWKHAVLCLVAQSCLTLCDPTDCSPPGSSVHGDSPGKNTRVGCHALLQGLFPTQGLNPGLPHCRQFLYHLRHQWSPTTYWNDPVLPIPTQAIVVIQFC